MNNLFAGNESGHANVYSIEVKAAIMSLKGQFEDVAMVHLTAVFAAAMAIKNGVEVAPESFILHKFCIKKNAINSTIKFSANKKPT